MSASQLNPRHPGCRKIPPNGVGISTTFCQRGFEGGCAGSLNLNLQLGGAPRLQRIYPIGISLPGACLGQGHVA